MLPWKTPSFSAEFLQILGQNGCRCGLAPWPWRTLKKGSWTSSVMAVGEIWLYLVTSLEMWIPTNSNPACAERASQSLMVWIFKIRSGILMEMIRQGSICDDSYRPGFFFPLHLTTLPETNIPPQKIGVGRFVPFGDAQLVVPIPKPPTSPA